MRSPRALRADGYRSLVLRGGAPKAEEVFGHATLAVELVQQAHEINLRVDRVVMASESAGTQAGLLSGLHGLGAAIEVRGVSVRRSRAEMESAVHGLANACCGLLGLDGSVARSAVQVDDGWTGPAYGHVTPEGGEAMALAARLEALLLDPVYTAKAMAALIAWARDGRFGRDENVVFLHSGGLPLLFAYADTAVIPQVRADIVG